MAGPHHGQPLLEKGEPLERATAAMVLLHGRGAAAEDIFIDCAALLEEPGFAFLAPQAYASRRARRYGAVVGFSGALIGPVDTPRDHAGWLAGTPLFLGCSEQDPYVSAAQVQASGEVLRGSEARSSSGSIRGWSTS